jgi:circadian clock protein KaiC
MAGYPKGRTTLVSGISGSGKTAFSAQFLYEGVVDFGENGVFVTFEESPEDIIRNTKSFGWNIDKLVKEGKWDFVDASSDDSSSVEVGRYDLGAFLARIAYAVEKVKAKRVVIDSVGVLFTNYQDQGVIRRESDIA